MASMFNVREVAELADVPVRSVNKAIEEGIVATVPAKRGRRKMLPLHAVPYAALVSKLELNLSKEKKRKLIRTFKARGADAMTSEPVEIAPSVIVDTSTLIGRDLAERAESYARSREEIIEENPDVLGGTPVIRGTRISVYSLLGRIEHGDSVGTIIEDYPDLSPAAVETAVIFARSHPLVGRPGGRPWRS